MECQKNNKEVYIHLFDGGEFDTFSFDVLRVVRVGVLAIDVCGSELKPVKYGTSVQFQYYIFVKHIHTLGVCELL